MTHQMKRLPPVRQPPKTGNPLPKEVRFQHNSYCFNVKVYFSGICPLEGTVCIAPWSSHSVGGGTTGHTSPVQQPRGAWPVANSPPSPAPWMAGSFDLHTISGDALSVIFTAMAGCPGSNNAFDEVFGQNYPIMLLKIQTNFYFLSPIGLVEFFTFPFIV